MGEWVRRISAPARPRVILMGDEAECNTGCQRLGRGGGHQRVLRKGNCKPPQLGRRPGPTVFCRERGALGVLRWSLAWGRYVRARCVRCECVLGCAAWPVAPSNLAASRARARVPVPQCACAVPSGVGWACVRRGGSGCFVRGSWPQGLAELSHRSLLGCLREVPMRGGRGRTHAAGASPCAGAFSREGRSLSGVWGGGAVLACLWRQRKLLGAASHQALCATCAEAASMHTLPGPRRRACLPRLPRCTAPSLPPACGWRARGRRRAVFPGPAAQALAGEALQ